MVEMIENRTWDEIGLGDSASLTRTCRVEDVEVFGIATGDFNPTHYTAADAEQLAHHPRVLAQSLWGGSLLSALLGNELPGPGTVYRNQEFEFHQPVEVGDTLTVSIVVVEKTPPNDVVFDCTAVNQRGEAVFRGRARVAAPTIKVAQPRVVLHEVRLRRRHHVFEDLIARCAPLEPISVAVCHPCDQVSLEGAADAARAGLITPVLVGPEGKIRAVAEEFSIDIAGLRILDTVHSHESAERAVALCRSGEAKSLMKGSLHTDETDARGRRRDNRPAHQPAHQPRLYHGRADLSAHAADHRRRNQHLPDAGGQGRHRPERHRPGPRAGRARSPRWRSCRRWRRSTAKIPSTLDAAALCKMADRGQITGGLLDGPLAFDNAVSEEAARTKEHQLAGRGPGRHPARARHRSRQHAGQATDLSRRRRRRRHRPRRPRADHADQPRRQRPARLASCAVAVLLAHAGAERWPRPRRS